MDADELEKLCRALSIKELEGGSGREALQRNLLVVLGNFLGRSPQRRLSDNWRNPKSQSSAGSSGARKGSSFQPTCQEKEKGLLIPKDSGVDSRLESSVLEVNHEPRNEENGEAMIIDVGENKEGDKKVGDLGGMGYKNTETKLNEVGCLENADKALNSKEDLGLLKPMSVALDPKVLVKKKENILSLGIELRKRAVGDTTKDLRSTKKKARVNNADDLGPSIQGVRDGEQGTKIEGLVVEKDTHDGLEAFEDRGDGSEHRGKICETSEVGMSDKVSSATITSQQSAMAISSFVSGGGSLVQGPVQGLQN
ncbi:hypothetical protein QYF36_011005 [Acer negundo]|nr:hypothetical protein QYF36_011005 [Acer negundo]